MKARSILCVIFVFFYCFVSDCCSHQQNQHPQPEDHWRWRRNLDIAVRIQEHQQPVGIIPIQAIHRQLKDHEQTITTHINGFNYLESNIATAAITIVYEGLDHENNQALMFKTRWLSLAQNGANLIYYFPSNEGTNIDLNQYETSLTQDLAPIGDHFRDILHTWDNNIDHHNLVIADTNNLYALITYYLDRQNTLDQNPAIPQINQYAQQLHHSEQRIMQYLSEPRVGDAEHELIHLVENMGVNPQCIKFIVVHIHSTRDPCENCNASLSLFSHYMNRAIQQHWQNVKFLITVSSRRSYQSSRYQQGHDIHSQNQNNRITINVAGFNPQLIQPLPPVPQPPIYYLMEEQPLHALEPLPNNLQYLPEQLNILYFQTTLEDLPIKQTTFLDLAG